MPGRARELDVLLVGDREARDLERVDVHLVLRHLLGEEARDDVRVRVLLDDPRRVLGERAHLERPGGHGHHVRLARVDARVARSARATRPPRVAA